MAEPRLEIIIGVSRGLGSAISKRFAAGGHPVAMAADGGVGNENRAGRDSGLAARPVLLPGMG